MALRRNLASIEQCESVVPTDGFSRFNSPLAFEVEPGTCAGFSEHFGQKLALSLT